MDCGHPECHAHENCLYTVRVVDAADMVEASASIIFWLLYIVFYVPIRLIVDLIRGRR